MTVSSGDENMIMKIMWEGRKAFKEIFIPFCCWTKILSLICWVEVFVKDIALSMSSQTDYQSINVRIMIMISDHVCLRCIL